MRTAVIAVDDTATPLAVLSIYQAMVRKPEHVVLIQVRKAAAAGSRTRGHDRSSDLRPAQLTQLSRQALESFGATRVTTTVIRNHAFAEMVLAVAREERADIIVIVFPRASGIQRLISGCAVEDVERRAPVPVIVAPRLQHFAVATLNWKEKESYAA